MATLTGMSNTQSPFSQPPKKFTFGLDWMLLVMMVSAATALMFTYALFLPAVTSELNAWMGRTVDLGEVGENRRAQIVFLMLCYAAPMILGLVARLIHLGGQLLAKRMEDKSDGDDEFTME